MNDRFLRWQQTGWHGLAWYLRKLAWLSEDQGTKCYEHRIRLAVRDLRHRTPF